jgi:hypothetical protein
VTLPVVWSFTGDNSTTRNLTVNFSTTYSETNVTDWRVNNVSIARVYSLDFNNASGWVNDYSTNDKNMNETITPPTPTTTGCVKGGCVIFDEVDDYLNTSNFLNLPQWTLTLWVRPNLATTTEQNIFSMDSDNAEKYFNLELNTQEEVGKRRDLLKLYMYDDSSLCYAKRIPLRSPGEPYLSRSSWTLFSVSYDNISKVMKIYDNASMIFNETIAGENVMFCPDLHEHPLLIGGEYLGESWSRMYNSSVDELKIFNRILDGDQIKAIYEEEKRNLSLTRITDGLTGCSELWSSAVTPLTYSTEGSPKYSNSVLITCPESNETVSIDQTSFLYNPVNDSKDNWLPYGVATAIVLIGLFLVVFRHFTDQKKELVERYSSEP